MHIDKSTKTTSNIDSDCNIPFRLREAQSNLQVQCTDIHIQEKLKRQNANEALIKEFIQQRKRK